jgi:hypothetical protein
MATPQYSAVNGPFTEPSTGQLTFAGNVFLRDLWLRGGGAVAPTNTELAATEYADAGIESMQLDIYELRDTLFAMTTQANDLRALLQVLTVRVEAIEQGTEL